MLYRKYRPQTFLEVIGQDPIVRTIKNAIKFKRVAHAYLFSGSRGTGKTTLARLFAKSLNCQNLTENFEPCNECRSCKEITNSRSLDVIEIDGASNRGIDDIRQINDTIGYAPSNRYKIYIIDEVHMLTKEAFNALLKTLEEPPENIKFFFATTEPFKVLPTIISRCQRFELKRISLESIIEKLSSIANDLNRKVDESALHMIASFSEGSLRDAESLLDQIFCYSDKDISLEYVTHSLGFIDKNYFFELDQNIFNQNTIFAFEFVEKIYNLGKDFTYMVEELIDHFKNILIIKLEKSFLLYISEDLKQKYIESSNLFSNEQLFYILDILSNAIYTHKNSFKRIHVETLLLKILKSKKIAHIDTLIKKLESFEKKSAPIQNIENQTIPEIKLSEMPIFEEKITFIEEKPIVVEEKTIFIEKKPLEKKIEAPKLSKDDEITHEENSKSRYDTLIKFTQVELGGIQKN